MPRLPGSPQLQRLDATLNAHVLGKPRATRFPEFRRPLAVDKVYLDRLGQPTPLPVGVQARGHFGVFEYHRGDFDLQAYARSPWAVIKDDWRKAFMRLNFNRTLVTLQTTYTTITGTARLVTVAAATVDFFNAAADNTQTFVGYGTDAAAATGLQNWLIAAHSSAPFDASSVAYDDGVFKVTLSGSRVHTEAAITAREIAAGRKLTGAGGLERYNFDRTVIADTAVGVNSTAAISYEIQW